MDQVVRRGFGRMVLRGLAIASALGFLTLVMVQAAAFYAPPPKGEPPPPRRNPRLLSAPTKATPVVRPTPREERLLESGTKAGYLGPLKLTLTPAGDR